MLKFPEDTRDNTERKYWPEVGKHYPAYKKFWERFIGVRPDKHLLPYGLKNKGVPITDEGEEHKQYFKMCMCHYSIFCDIVIAQKEFEDIIKPAQERESLSHWRYFENFYMRLRSIEDRFKRMWGFAEDFCPTSRVKKVSGFFGYIEEHKQDDIVQKYCRWRLDVRVIRNNVIHFARLGAVMSKQGFQIPSNPSKLTDQKGDILWLALRNVTKEDLIPTTKRMEKDLATLFDWLQPLEETLINDLEEALEQSSITVDYDAAEPTDKSKLSLPPDFPIPVEELATSGTFFEDGSAEQDAGERGCGSCCESTNESGAVGNPEEDNRNSGNKS